LAEIKGELPEVESEYLGDKRRGFLASGGRGKTTIVPVCFASRGNVIYTPIDRKPKGKRLARLSKIRLNPHVAFIVDTYSEKWNQLSYLLVHGDAEVVRDDREARKARKLLLQKYPQYRQMKLGNALVIAIRIKSSKFWQFHPS
jgi:PPOX class probable F420-dependent enzyme